VLLLSCLHKSLFFNHGYTSYKHFIYLFIYFCGGFLSGLQERHISTFSIQEMPHYFQEPCCILKSTWALKLPASSQLSTARTLAHWYVQKSLSASATQCCQLSSILFYSNFVSDFSPSLQKFKFLSQQPKKFVTFRTFLSYI
jgi:hypothetical protein